MSSICQLCKEEKPYWQIKDYIIKSFLIDWKFNLCDDCGKEIDRAVIEVTKKLQK